MASHADAAVQLSKTIHDVGGGAQGVIESVLLFIVKERKRREQKKGLRGPASILEIDHLYLKKRTYMKGIKLSRLMVIDREDVSRRNNDKLAVGSIIYCRELCIPPPPHFRTLSLVLFFS